MKKFQLILTVLSGCILGFTNVSGAYAQTNDSCTKTIINNTQGKIRDLDKNVLIPANGHLTTQASCSKLRALKTSSRAVTKNGITSIGEYDAKGSLTITFTGKLTAPSDSCNECTVNNKPGLMDPFYNICVECN